MIIDINNILNNNPKVNLQIISKTERFLKIKCKLSAMQWNRML